MTLIVTMTLLFHIERHIEKVSYTQHNKFAELTLTLQYLCQN